MREQRFSHFSAVGRHPKRVVSQRGNYLRRRHSVQHTAALLAMRSYLAAASSPLSAIEPIQISMTPDHWTTVSGPVNFVEHMGKPSIELQPGDYKKGVPEGGAALKDFQFRNGTIEYDVAAEKGMGAAFIFRSAGKDTSEMFYLRPRANCQEAPDCVQYAPQTHGVLL